MELKITYVLYLNSLDIISEHKTKFKIKSVLSTQKIFMKMQEMKLIRCRLCKFKCTLLEITKAKVYKTSTTNITFC